MRLYLKKRWQRFLDNFSWHRTVLRIKLWTMKNKVKHKWLRSKYCNLGFHKLEKGKYSFKYDRPKAITQNVHYITCKMCNYAFFVTPGDKKRYLDHKKQMSTIMKYLYSTKKLDKGGVSSS